MQRPSVPGTVRIAQVLLLLESLLWLLPAAGLIWLGIAARSVADFLHNSNSSFNNAFSNVTGAFGAVVVAFGVVIAIIAISGLWSGAILGRLTGGPRVVAILLSVLGLLLGLLFLTAGGRSFTDSSGNTYGGGGPVAGIVVLAFNGVIFFCLAVAGSTRAAYRAMTPGGYAATPQMLYGTPPPGGALPPGSGNYANQGYPQQPGYGQQPGFAQQPGYPPPEPGYPHPQPGPPQPQSYPQPPGYGPPPGGPPPPGPPGGYGPPPSS